MPFLFQILPNSVVSRYCGHVFLIAEVQLTSQAREPDMMNNVRSAPLFIQCQGGMFMVGLHCSCLGCPGQWLSLD